MEQLTDEELVKIERQFEEFDPDTATVYEAGEPVPASLALVRAQAARTLYEHQADQVMTEAIRNARGQGLSWHKIGLVLGTTGEAARQRYTSKV